MIPTELTTTRLLKEEIKLGKRLTGGQYGDLFLGECRGSTVAVKIPKTKNLSSKELKEFYEEIVALCKYRHPNIILLLGAYLSEQGSEIQIVMEKMDIDLKTVLEQKDKYKYTLYQRMSFAKQAAIGMQWLHAGNLIHCDYKPANLLLSFATNTIKICDFGFARILPKGENLLDHCKGSPVFAAPEIFLDQPTSSARDVYAHVCGDPPFDNWNQGIREFVKKVVNKANPLRPTLPESELICPQSVRELAEECWNAKQEKRPTFKQILERMDEILVDCAIFDEKARKFWKQNYCNKNENIGEVDEIKFISNFASVFGSTENELHERTTQVLFCKNGKANIEHFGNMIGYFESLSLHTEGWLEWISNLLLNEKYIFGDKNVKLGPNNFIVRFSALSDWTLKYQNHKIKINHENSSRQYVVDSKQIAGQWTSLRECVFAIIKALKLNLEPAPNAPFHDALNVEVEEYDSEEAEQEN